MIEKLKHDMVEAMKNKEKEKLSVIRMVKASMDQEHIDRKREINDELLIDVVNKQIKMRKDSIVEFEKGGRSDLVEKTQSEIDLLLNYLPEQLSGDEVYKIIDEIFSDVDENCQIPFRECNYIKEDMDDTAELFTEEAAVDEDENKIDTDLSKE